MRVLVTGGAGYIGSHTAKALARSGFEPIVLDNLSTGHRWAVKWGTLIEGDLGDSALIREVIKTHRVQAVVHFAGFAYVGESMQRPRQYFRNNVTYTLRLLDAMTDMSVKHIVFSSSCATYGIPASVPIREEQVQAPINPYGESKRMVERILAWYGEAYGLRWTALRYFNAAGADPDGELGEDHSPETHLIPLAIQAALGEKPALEIYGTDYLTPDHTAIRDYTHVMDLAEAHVAALGHMLRSQENAAINLGTGSGHSVRQVVAAVERASGRRVPIHEAQRRAGDPPELVADPARAKELLGWRPRYSSLESIVQTAWNWHISRKPTLGGVDPPQQNVGLLGEARSHATAA
ncbi:MAG: UDP-glucose 4-epimerase GalE [Acidobacteria bacterium]|nr:MAG: UDP-glucose 4-epimerase GalE [Acidobacteriota bacterium]